MSVHHPSSIIHPSVFLSKKDRIGLRADKEKKKEIDTTFADLLSFLLEIRNYILLRNLPMTRKSKIK